MLSAVALAYNGGLGMCPQRGPGAQPLVRGSGCEAPQKLNTTIHFISQFSPNVGTCHFDKIATFCKLLKLGLHVLWQFLTFFRKHKRCCFDKLMYVRSIGFTLRESTRYTTYSRPIMKLTTKVSLTQKHKAYTQQQSSAGS